MAGSRVSLGDHTLTPYLDSQRVGVFVKKNNQNTLKSRDSGNANPPTMKPLAVMSFHKISFYTHKLLTMKTLFKNKRHLPIDWKWYSPRITSLVILSVRDFNYMSGDLVKYHIICEYINCIPKKFST